MPGTLFVIGRSRRRTREIQPSGLAPLSTEASGAAAGKFLLGDRHRGTTTDHAPRCWIGSLAAYSAGHLIGDWYRATEAGDVTVADLHKGSSVSYTDNEIWTFDLDGHWPISREVDPTEAARWGEVYEEVGDTRWPAVCAWVRSGGYVAEGDTDYPCVGEFEDVHCGEWDSFRDCAFHLAEDMCRFDDLDYGHVAVRYFNWDSWIADAESDYSVEITGHGGYFVFRNY